MHFRNSQVVPNLTSKHKQHTTFINRPESNKVESMDAERGLAEDVQSPTIPAERDEKYHDLQQRLISFREIWKQPTSTQHAQIVRAARAGYYYSGQSGMISCFCCGTLVGGWEEEDFNWSVNEKCAPDCLHAKLRYEHFEARSRSMEDSSGSEGEGSSATAVMEWKYPLEHDYVQLSQCRLCRVVDINCVLVPCGHMVCCIDCVESIKLCPRCDKRIEKFVRAQLPEIL